MPLSRPQGVAIVGIYPCGKAQKNPPFPSRLIVSNRSSPSRVRFAPLTAPGRSERHAVYEGKGGLGFRAVWTGRKETFRPYPPRGKLGRLREHVTQTDPDRKDRLMKGLDGFLGRDRDRELFDLPQKEIANG